VGTGWSCLPPGQASYLALLLVGTLRVGPVSFVVVASLAAVAAAVAVVGKSLE